MDRTRARRTCTGRGGHLLIGALLLTALGAAIMGLRALISDQHMPPSSPSILTTSATP